MKSSKRKTIFVALTIFIILILISVYNKPIIFSFVSNYIYPKKQGFEFLIKPCNQVSAYEKDKMGIQEITWINDNALSVKVYISTFCGGEDILFPSYQITSNDITLKYTSVKGYNLTKCTCTRELIYTIHNLAKKDYNILLKSSNL